MQILLGYTPTYAEMPWSPANKLRFDILEDKIAAAGLDTTAREAHQYHTRYMRSPPLLPLLLTLFYFNPLRVILHDS